MLAIAGGKGGCGKTTTALGLAAALARGGDTTPLVADFDAEMPDVHVVADTPAGPGLGALADGRDLAAVAHATRLQGVRAVPADGLDAECVPRVVERLVRWPGPTLLDCPAGASRAVARPLRAADHSLLVATPTRACLADTAKTAAMARELDAPPVGVVLNRVDHSGRAIGARAVRQLFEGPVLARVASTGDSPLRSPDVRLAHDRVARKINERNL
jgi:septum site-determining protein MinD